MTVTNQNFEMYAGESKTLQVAVTNDLGAPKDLTSSQIKWALCKVGETLILKETPTDIVITNPTGGLFTVNLDATDTETLGTGFYQHQSIVTDLDGSVAIIFSGIVSINNSLFD